MLSLFFCFKQKTAYGMRISDWSSDVCSSDLAAAPDFFAHPRIVAAVTGEGDDAAALLKDRLYIGYQEQSALLEVISYNEAAGRFEFQLVHDYRAGATPRVSYARRELCAACHQNLAPIFSRPLRSEEHTSELQSLMRISYAVFCLKKKKYNNTKKNNIRHSIAIKRI